MTTLEIKEKLENAMAKASKISTTIDKLKKQATKKLQVLEKVTDEHDKYWAKCEYEEKLEQIKNNEQKLVDAKKIVENWKNKLDIAARDSIVFELEIPQVMKNAMDKMVELWNEYDLQRKAEAKELKQKMEYWDWLHKIGRATYELCQKSDDEIKTLNKRMAREWLLDLYYRVKDITGDITDCSELKFGGKSLNGFIRGKKNWARVETITASGIVQRPHLRVLVHKGKEA